MILFGLPEKKDEVATGAWDEDGIVQRAARAIKREVPEMLLIADVCLCEYMSHGHCGVVRSSQGRDRWELRRVKRQLCASVEAWRKPSMPPPRRLPSNRSMRSKMTRR